MKWNYRLNIRQYLTEETTQEAMLAAAKGIRQEVAKLPPGLSRRANGILETVDKAAQTGVLDWFNASLSRLWDWFDNNAIWVEL